jgi:hypothetical protein
LAAPRLEKPGAIHGRRVAPKTTNTSFVYRPDRLERFWSAGRTEEYGCSIA